MEWSIKIIISNTTIVSSNVEIKMFRHDFKNLHENAPSCAKIFSLSHLQNHRVKNLQSTVVWRPIKHVADRTRATTCVSTQKRSITVCFSRGHPAWQLSKDSLRLSACSPCHHRDKRNEFLSCPRFIVTSFESFLLKVE